MHLIKKKLFSVKVFLNDDDLNAKQWNHLPSTINTSANHVRIQLEKYILNLSFFRKSHFETRK